MVSWYVGTLLILAGLALVRQTPIRLPLRLSVYLHGIFFLWSLWIEPTTGGGIFGWYCLVLAVGSWLGRTSWLLLHISSPELHAMITRSAETMLLPVADNVNGLVIRDAEQEIHLHIVPFGGGVLLRWPQRTTKRLGLLERMLTKQLPGLVPRIAIDLRPATRKESL